MNGVKLLLVNVPVGQELQILEAVFVLEVDSVLKLVELLPHLLAEPELVFDVRKAKITLKELRD